MSQKNKSALVAAALCGVSLGMQAAAKEGDKPPQAVTQEVERCYGINRCKGMNSCDVSQSDIAAANAKYKNKFKNNSPYGCSGEVKGPAKKGYLGWIYVEAEGCLKVDGGFLIEDKDGKKVVVD